MSDVLTAGVKYCGGCNPRYDRVGLVNRLSAAYPSLRIEAARPGTVYDFLLVVCGCSARCADTTGLEGRLGRVFLSSEAGYADAEEMFKKGLDL